MSAAGASRCCRRIRSDRDDAKRRGSEARRISQPAAAAPAEWRRRRTAGRAGGGSIHAPTPTPLRTRRGRLLPRSCRRRRWAGRWVPIEPRGVPDADTLQRASPVLRPARLDIKSAGRLALIGGCRGPEAVLFRRVQAAGDGGGLCPDEAVAVAQRLAQDRTQIG